MQKRLTREDKAALSLRTAHGVHQQISAVMDAGQGALFQGELLVLQRRWEWNDELMIR